MCTLEPQSISISPTYTPQEQEHKSHRRQQQQWSNNKNSASPNTGSRSPPNPGFTCPACGQRCYRPTVLQRHIFKCCPDILSTTEWDQVVHDHNTIRSYLITAQQQELLLRKHALDVAFRQRDSNGAPLKLGPEEVSQALNLPLPRAQRLLRKGMSSIPLVADTEWPIEVVYDDDDLIAINKDPGIITAPKHRFMGGSLVNRIKGRMGFEPAVLHRLDMDTSGVILFARARDIVPAVHAAFRNKTIHKEYLAVVAGIPEWTELTVDAAIDRNEHDKIARKVVVVGGEGRRNIERKGEEVIKGPTFGSSEGAKPAVTKFKVIATVPQADLSMGTPSRWSSDSAASIIQGASLISCSPLTGRTHQIRVHLGHVGHPIVGDDLYGIMGPWLTRQALHAFKISLVHPRSGGELEIVAPLPEDIKRAMEMLGFEEEEMVV